MDAERRAVEFREVSPGVIEGILIPYGVPSRIGGVFDEEFRAGSVRIGDVLANRQHDRTRPLARIGHGLTLTDASDALRARLELPDTVEGRDTRTLVALGVLRGLSAEFRTIQDEWPSETRRIIHQAELRGLAVVDDPGHTGAVIEEVRARLADAERPPVRRRVWL